jgi:2-desacetyl-2-hydroxyethyl bacteriochlorophyllide A dehydrogenase
MAPHTRLDRVCLALTGQDALVVKHQLEAIVCNLITWLLVTVGLRKVHEQSLPLTSKVLPRSSLTHPDSAAAVLVLSPGGLERLSLEQLGDTVATVGYNVKGVDRLPGCNSLCRTERLPPDCVIVRIQSCSINYADVCIRWGLYESAIRFVGYPICPGFDFSGVVERAGAEANVRAGDEVFGITFFGAYSSRLLVPCRQLSAKPKEGSLSSSDEAAALPSVAGTALHALRLAGFWPSPPLTRNRAVLVHSAAGGVGSMLVQMAKALGCSPVVGVVGSSHKVSACRALGADLVIDKSSADLWEAAEAAAPNGFAAIFDANGVATLSRSYEHLAQTGTLVVFGFHTNLPSAASLSPLAWVRMGAGIARMPKFDPMDLVLSSKNVCGFNLSFFSEELELVDAYMKQIVEWAKEGRLRVGTVTAFKLSEVPSAHSLIQSGKSIGKIVLHPPHGPREVD